MLEAKLAEAGLLKKLLDAIKELVTDANFTANEEGFQLQAMDNSHVALVAVKLQASGFKKFRCDRPMQLGVNLNSLTKVLKCAKDDDICTLKAGDEADLLSLVYEAKGSDRIAEYEMKLMEIDSDQLSIPETAYDARVTMPAAEFARIVRDLSQLGESVRIEVSKEGVRFASEGEAANGNVLLKQTEGVITSGDPLVADPKDGNDDEDEEKEDDDDDDEDDEDGDKKKRKVKKEKGGKSKKVKKEDDGDVDMDDKEEEEQEQEFKPESDEEGEEEKPDADSDDEESSGKKRRKKVRSSAKPSKKAKTSTSKGKGKSKSEDDGPDGVVVEMNQHVSLTFSLKYLVNFAKSTSLSKNVQLMMSGDVPLLVSYDFGPGYIRYYLAPKIGDD
ncbi:proliferating cell nuclear antigen [Coprinopsis marcescibilis]|uniref:DNA sliding clamp PCNA n=1 Tax=Coprinopsis marcescibilis TaxID=230819 RepID=A0A5C3KNG8_COPMA|nr:proliferating cell nuclear antigen [Coprinopsis marcescibilis]